MKTIIKTPIIFAQLFFLFVESQAKGYRIKKEDVKCYQKENSFFEIYDQGTGEEKPWYINDHCFIKEENGKWHLSGITHEEPSNPLGEDNFTHVIADDLIQQPWEKQPFALSVVTEFPWYEIHHWAPHVIFFEGVYYMYYFAGGDSHTTYKIYLATSKDLMTWERHPENPMAVDGFDGRGLFILRVKDIWIMYYTANRPAEKGNHVVIAVVSDDLIHWEYENRVADIPSHCAEVIHTSDDIWYISQAGWARGGVYLAELFWKE